MPQSKNQVTTSWGEFPSKSGSRPR